MVTSLLEAALQAGQPKDTLPAENPHVLICTPCHSGKVDLNYHISMALATTYLSQHGVNYTLDYNVGMSIDVARSQMATTFLKNDQYTHLLFIDDDMAFAADLPYRLLIENVDIVAVPYRRKIRDVKYNIRHGVMVKTIPGRPYMASVESIATGLMMVRKNVFKKLETKVAEFLYNNDGEKGRLFFRHQIVEDEMVGGTAYMGEDYYFCKIARENGFDVWAYVDENVAHIGTYAFDGNYRDAAERGTNDKFNYDKPKLLMRLLTQ